MISWLTGWKTVGVQWAKSIHVKARVWQSEVNWSWDELDELLDDDMFRTNDKTAHVCCRNLISDYDLWLELWWEGKCQSVLSLTRTCLYVIWAHAWFTCTDDQNWWTTTILNTNKYMVESICWAPHLSCVFSPVPHWKRRNHCLRVMSFTTYFLGKEPDSGPSLRRSSGWFASKCVSKNYPQQI